jgi:cell wall-associated NlpC family hydrolase
MNNKGIRAFAAATAAVLLFSSTGLDAYAAGNISSVLPSAGINYSLSSNGTALSSMQKDSDKKKSSESTADSKTADTSKSTLKTINVGLTALADNAAAISAATAASATADTTAETSTETTEKKIEDTVIVSQLYEQGLAQATNSNLDSDEKDDFDNLVIAQVDDYVNVRSTPSEDGDVLGKLYNNSVGTYEGEENGWYKISSGSVEGYVKAEYCVTGNDAKALAQKVGKRIATVTTTTLKVRSDASADASVVGLVPVDDELLVSQELDGWVKVNIEEGDGYVSDDYVKLSTEFVTAESKAEEEARLAKEAAEVEKAKEEAAAKEKSEKAQSSKKGSSGSSDSKYKDSGSYAAAGSASGSNVAKFALQFVGNPYVYGGTSLTNGTDCSGFVMSVYKNFGVSLPHSSSADRSVGATVSSLSEAQPGDLICYSGHVALYIGNGQIVHASTARTGIITSTASYRDILSIRRVL